MNADSLVVLDFETTGLSPNNGDRAIEIGAVRIKNGEITERFQQLMNPGIRVNSFIEQYTGITNQMLKNSPSCEQVMTEFAEFLGADNLVAHNASFDKRFLDAEFARLGINYQGKFSCSLLLARRICQDAPDHKLGTLVKYCDIEGNGNFHRALFDAEMTAKVWIAMLNRIRQHISSTGVTFELIQRISKASKRDLAKILSGI